MARVGPEFAEMYGLFPDPDGAPHTVAVPEDQVPAPYTGLLVHHHHMTVTVEVFYRSPVRVLVMESTRREQTYCRKILLQSIRDNRIVQFGLVRINLDYCSPEVAAAIVGEKTPLGRVLIEHGVLTSVQPTGYLRVEPNACMRQWFGMSEPEVTYGRIGVILCDAKPAIEMLEILSPVRLP